jgi:catechol-2,3-dioxygenase
MTPSRIETQIEGTTPSSMPTPFKEKVLSPISLAHVVFRTSNYDKMVTFWTSFLGATIAHSNPALTFLRYDDEHHRIAIIAVPGTTPRVPTAAGLHHVAFSFSSISDLVHAYQQRKALGILPTWSVNHGPTTSIYYQDPDHNLIETQVDNYDSVEEANKFMQSELFRENPIGTDFDPEELVQMIQSGVKEDVIKRRVEVGPRGVPEGF